MAAECGWRDGEGLIEKYRTGEEGNKLNGLLSSEIIREVGRNQTAEEASKQVEDIGLGRGEAVLWREEEEMEGENAEGNTNQLGESWTTRLETIQTHGSPSQ